MGCYYYSHAAVQIDLDQFATCLVKSQTSSGDFVEALFGLVVEFDWPTSGLVEAAGNSKMM